MSYNNYNQGGYGQSNPYSQSNPYGQSNSYSQSNPYGQSNSYNQSNPYGQPSAPPPTYGGHQNYNQYNSEVEMQPYSNQSPPETPQNAAESLLNDLRSIDSGLSDLDQQITRLQAIQRRALDSPSTTSNVIQELESITNHITGTYRGYLTRVKNIKSRPQPPIAGPHIARLEARLKAFQNNFMRVEHSYQQGMRDQAARQYRIVRPDATEDEVRAATEDPTMQQQVFSQALMNSNRRGQGQSVLSAVRERHEAIQKIERQLIELAQLFNEMENMVVQQETAIQQVEMRTEETKEELVQANVHMDQAVKHGYDLRRHKWKCFWICVVLLLVIVAIAVVVVELNKPKTSSAPAPAPTQR